MPDTFADRYPEAAPYIQRAVDEDGEEWVLEKYHQHLYPLARIMTMPEKDELPFYDPKEQDTMIDHLSALKREDSSVGNPACMIPLAVNLRVR